MTVAGVVFERDGGFSDNERDDPGSARPRPSTATRICATPPRERLFNAASLALRVRVEQTFAWEDKFKRSPLRFEVMRHRRYGTKLMAYTVINLRGSVLPETRDEP
jgi:hypothetical protein